MGKKARKDEDDRIFICGCGRSYLSYPALYIHVRNKHNGIRQQNTILPNKGEIQKQQQRQKMARNGDVEQDGYYETNQQRQSQEQVLKQIAEYLQFRAKQSIIQRKLITSEEDEKINFYNLFLEYEKDILDYLSDQNYLQDYNKIKQELQSLYQQEEEEVEINLEEDENGNFKTSIDFILSQFLQSISKELNEEGYLEMSIFVIMLRKGLNVEALKYMNLEDFCQNYSGDDVLELFNNLCVNFFPQELKRINELPTSQRQLIIFDMYGDMMQAEQVYEKNNIVRLLHAFSKWMYCSKFTQYTLTIEQDYFIN